MDRRPECMPSSGGGNSHLRRVLNVMFPPAYIELYHRPPKSVCSLLNLRCLSVSNTRDELQIDGESNLPVTFETSSEPSPRSYVLNLRQQFDDSLHEHRAKLVLDSAERTKLESFTNQQTDELIRQVTVGCIEQGLLLFRIRNELRMTINYYRKAFESGVKFGLSKAIEAELALEENSAKIEQLELDCFERESKGLLTDRISELEVKNKVESVDRMKEYYKNQLAKRDQIIEQQRAIIKGLSQRSIEEMKSSI